MAFYPGQRVICVDDSPDWMGRPIMIVKGQIYTIKSFFTLHGIHGVLLEEVSPGEAPGWTADRFRPVTDISEFKKLTKTAPVLEDA